MENPAAARDGSLAALEVLSEELKDAFRRWEENAEGWSDERVDELARRAFAVQRAGNVPYRRYCRRLGIEPDQVAGWREVPPVPTAAFREVSLVVGDPADAALEFRTSGTSRGESRRGRHLVRDPELYRISLEATFWRFVLRTDGKAAGPQGRVPIGSLVPAFADAPHSSLSWMADAVVGRFGAPSSRWLATRAGVAWEEANRFAADAAKRAEAVCLFGTTLAFDAWTRRLEADGRRIGLPAGSLVMDTGGSKGLEASHRDEILARLERFLGVPPSAVVNEFGMTELLSQRFGSPAALIGPPWLRSRALDPVTLEEVPAGEVGVLAHFDLANVGSVCSVLTEDLGSVQDGVLGWVGRTPGSPPRGCSLATEELLRSQAAGETGS
jgi:hypothetical protein